MDKANRDILDDSFTIAHNTYRLYGYDDSDSPPVNPAYAPMPSSAYVKTSFIETQQDKENSLRDKINSLEHKISEIMASVETWLDEEECAEGDEVFRAKEAEKKVSSIMENQAVEIRKLREELSLYRKVYQDKLDEIIRIAKIDAYKDLSNAIIENPFPSDMFDVEEPCSTALPKFARYLHAQIIEISNKLVTECESASDFEVEYTE